MASKNHFDIREDNVVVIHAKDDSWRAYATYRDDYIEELTKATWTLSNKYVKNDRYGYLHGYIMGKWYGVEMVEAMHKEEWAIDHIDHNRLHCEISNLAFLPRYDNLAKGLTLDKEIDNLFWKLPLYMYKDFETQYFQLAMYFNLPIMFYNCENRKWHEVEAVRFLYPNDYQLVLLDARELLLGLSHGMKLRIPLPNCIDFIIYGSQKVKIETTSDEAKMQIIQRNGEAFFRQGGTIVKVIPLLKGWTPHHYPE